jgi:hypothetical protein
MPTIAEGRPRIKWGQFLISAVEDFNRRGKDHFLHSETEGRI